MISIIKWRKRNNHGTWNGRYGNVLLTIVARADDKYLLRISKRQGEVPNDIEGLESLEAAKEKAEEFRRNDGRN